jgi:hypothetical protein
MYDFFFFNLQRHDIVKKRIDAHSNVIEVRQDGIGAPKVSKNFFSKHFFFFTYLVSDGSQYIYIYIYIYIFILRLVNTQLMQQHRIEFVSSSSTPY